MKKIVFASIICLSIYSCGGDPKTTETKTAADMNPTFDKYKEEVKVSDELYKSSMYNGERHGY